MFNLLLCVWCGIARRPARNESGQSTAEYALVMLAAAAIAGLVLMWAHKTNIVSDLFSSVLHKVLPL
ncbi:MAG TPA: DUF4244 domain-containing protein [Acidimicrobiia bacterium]|nr:DUF4244 domain-containing protein [Acidimicrobiia bacterium]